MLKHNLRHCRNRVSNLAESPPTVVEFGRRRRVGGDTLFEVTDPGEIREVHEQLQFQSP
jgi:hypothetical protein